MAFVSQIEPNDVSEALINKYWSLSMQEDLDQFDRNNVWELIPKLSSNIMILTNDSFATSLTKM